MGYIARARPSYQILGIAVKVVNNQNPEGGYLPANELLQNPNTASIKAGVRGKY